MAGSAWRIRLVDAVDDAEWDELLASDARATLFQHPTWLRRYVRHHRHKLARWIEARDGDGRLRAGLPFAHSSRFGMRALASGVAGTYGGPVRDPGAEEAEARLVQRYLRVGGFRTVLREMLWGHAEPPAGGEAVMIPLEASQLHLEGGFERVWREEFPKNRRNECNRSERRGLRTEIGRDPTWLESFLPLYRKRCSEWGTRPLSSSFLHAVLEEEPAACLVRAVFEGRQVGLHVCFELPSQVMAWVGSSERLREVFPAPMLIRQEVLFALERGHVRLNLGGSLGLHGVSRFKELMGAHHSRAWLLRREAGWLRRLRGR